jgi:hypothetical protein
MSSLLLCCNVHLWQVGAESGIRQRAQNGHRFASLIFFLVKVGDTFYGQVSHKVGLLVGTIMSHQTFFYILMLLPLEKHLLFYFYECQLLLSLTES